MPKLRQRLAQLLEPRLDRLAAPEAGAVLEVDAVGAGVLRDDQDFLDPGARQAFGFGQHVADRARHQRPAQRGDDAEGAAVVAALGNLQVGEVVRRQAHALLGNQRGERVVRLRQVLMDDAHHLVRRVRAGHGEHRWVRIPDDVALGAEAAGDDDAAVLGQRLADRVERFLHRGVDETAGIDDDQIGIVIGRRHHVALGTQLGQDVFGVDGGLRATQRNEADGRDFCIQILHLWRLNKKAPIRDQGFANHG